MVSIVAHLPLERAYSLLMIEDRADRDQGFLRRARARMEISRNAA
jgi:hypothetical protein